MEWYNQPARHLTAPDWALAMVIVAVVGFGMGWAIGAILGAM